jgi:Arc/MetJ-type ribon-helix-helix transcriptional regulator
MSGDDLIRDAVRRSRERQRALAERYGLIQPADDDSTDDNDTDSPSATEGV